MPIEFETLGKSESGRTVTVRVRYEPGNGTSYRLIVVVSGRNVDLVAWPDLRWSSGDFGEIVSAEWLRGPGRLKNKADATAVADAVALVQTHLAAKALAAKKAAEAAAAASPTP